MKGQQCVYIDKERNLRFMEPTKVYQKDAGSLFADLYERQKEVGGLFFGVDTAEQLTRLENLQTNQDGLTTARKRYLRTAWEHPFDIDFRLAVSQKEGQPGKTVYHEVKAMQRTLDKDGKGAYQYGGKDADGNYRYGETSGLYAGWEQVTSKTRGMIPVELVGDLQLMDEYGGRLERVGGKWVSTPAKEQKSVVPDTNIISFHMPGSGWGVKGTFQADYFHFYLPMMPGNEGRIEASTEEIERMQSTTKPGAKLITEAPTGLFITISKAVKDALYQLSLQWLADHFNKVESESLSERREVLEEFWETDEDDKRKVKSINVSVPVTLLVKAFENAGRVSDRAVLEVRPVVKFIRNGSNTAEIEIANNGREYWTPERLQAVYFRGLGLKHDIQGYWYDAPSYIHLKKDEPPIYGLSLLSSFGFENCIRHFHVSAPEPETEGEGKSPIE